jgi:hypothetical protein
MIEYKNLITQYPPSEEQLTQLGADGWDMCGVNGNTYHFKREFPPVNEQLARACNLDEVNAARLKFGGEIKPIESKKNAVKGSK